MHFKSLLAECLTDTSDDFTIQIRFFLEIVIDQV